MVFGVSEYTLVFRRVLHAQPDLSSVAGGWIVTRPALMPCPGVPVPPAAGEVEQVLTVRICSTLAMEDAAYERFLIGSGLPRAALRLVARMRLDDPRSVEMTRRKIQSLVMRVEVRHIADALSA